MTICNIANAFTESAARLPEQIGLIVPRGETDSRYTFAELARQVDRYVGALTAAGLGRHDRVLLMVRPSLEFICLAFALFKVGAPVILIDPGMGYANLLRCIEKVSPTVFIGIPQAQAFRLAFPGVFRTIRLAICVGGNAFGLLGVSLARLATRATGNSPAATTASTDLAAIIFTTGSTGPPKGVRYEHGVFQAQLDLIRDFYEITAADIDQPAFPLFALFSMALGAGVVIPDMDAAHPARVDPARFIRTINRYKVTYSFGSPAIWNVVADYCLPRKIELPSLRLVLMAGAPVAGELIGRVKRILPAAALIHTPYGATESLPVASLTDREILAETWTQSRAGAGICVGRPLPGLDLRIIRITDEVIVDWKDVTLLPAGEIGEIVVRGPVVTRAYEGNDRENRLAKIVDNAGGFWHRMGDTGYLDADGRLWFCGRRAHRVVIAQGRTLYTIPCEAIFNQHPAVLRSALVGVPAVNQEGQTPVLLVELRKGGKPGQDFTAELNQLAQAHAHTRAIRHFLIHPAFPVDIRHNAKIFREKLAVWAATRL